jgi:hypothetical protein
MSQAASFHPKPADGLGDPGSVRAGARIETVVCAMDFTLESDLACAGAADLARSFAARLLLVHVAADRDGHTRARERLAVYTPSWLEGVSTTTHVRSGDPANEIARLARQERADLIVVGAHGPDGPLVPCGIEAGLAAAAPCPVLALRGRDDARRVIDQLNGRSSPHRCSVCGRPFDTTICPTCGARIAYEAMEHKWHHDLHEGPGLMGLGGVQALGPAIAPPPPPDRPSPRPAAATGEPRRPARRWPLSRLTSFFLRRRPSP